MSRCLLRFSERERDARSCEQRYLALAASNPFGVSIGPNVQMTKRSSPFASYLIESPADSALDALNAARSFVDQSTSGGRTILSCGSSSS